ncbi:hypothetical protein [Streptomyces sp. NPDC056982]|uniref:hypothetical protein n=1 Tax=Streptomyces sp. NPDC056982 TaxID=3345986 RepID=UPI003635813D
MAASPVGHLSPGRIQRLGQAGQAILDRLLHAQPSQEVSRIASRRAPSSSLARGSAQRLDGAAKTS